MSKLNKLRGPFCCRVCDKQYYTRRSKGEGEKCCSRECGFKYLPHCENSGRQKPKPVDVSRIVEGAFCKIHIVGCVHCNELFCSRYNAKYCSRECSISAATYSRAKNSEPKTCLNCGAQYCHLWSRFCKKGPIEFCSDECAIQSARSHKRSKYRQRVKPGAVVHVVIAHRVFDRDGWKCRHCGCETHQNLRGTYDDNAPELDHVIPLAVGGSHTYENTQLLCRVCNIMKSSMSMLDFTLWNKGIGAGSSAAA